MPLQRKNLSKKYLDPTSFFLLGVFLLVACNPAPEPRSDKIDYTEQRNWYTYGKSNSLDTYIPNSLRNLSLPFKEVAVFYAHPTTYWGLGWNADIGHLVSESRVENLFLINQASAFAACCNVFTPRYRQANLFSFLDQSGGGQEALTLAYKDIKNAFL